MKPAGVKYPSFSIDQLQADKLPDDMLNVDHFGHYLDRNPHLNRIHRHSFYHIVFFTQGKGRHILDFEQFNIQPGMIYFMGPDQVHHWLFEEAADGYILNFSPLFFVKYLWGLDIARQFGLFGADPADQVRLLGAKDQEIVSGLFEQMIAERDRKNPGYGSYLATLILQLFITAQRAHSDNSLLQDNKIPDHKRSLIAHFRKLADIHYKDKKLPSHYAALLHINANHLNVICQEILGISAGAVIRKRILLEAKRLLVNAELSVSSVAWELGFSDTSYFSKFFKKYEGYSPEVFRKQYLG